VYFAVALGLKLPEAHSMVNLLRRRAGIQ